MKLKTGNRTETFHDDLQPEGLLHGAFKLSDHARAGIKSIDTTKAEAIEEFKVITADDVPGELRWFNPQRLAVFIPIGGQTSYLGMSWLW